MSYGIDYGNGQTNINHTTGIRYGVISQNEVLQAWADESEPDYGDTYYCPKCGNEITIRQTDDMILCPDCNEDFTDSDCLPEEPLALTYERDGYKCSQGSDGDIFILESPYYTFAQFCSPCAPGACYLTSTCEPDTNNRAYCFGHDWFEDGIAPYPVYSVETGKLVSKPD